MSARDFVRRTILHNLTLKLTALVLAVGLWIAVSSSPPAEVALNVAVIFRNMPADLEISSENIPTVQIRVRGPEAIVRRLQPSDVHAEIDISGIKPGERTFDLTHQISVPEKLEVAQVVPSEMHLAFDVRATRVVPVEPRVTGKPAEGYRIAAVDPLPATVEITGPRKVVDSIASAVTDPVDVTGVLAQTTVTRHAYVSDPLVQVTNPRTVQVRVTMEKEAAPSKTHPE